MRAHVWFAHAFVLLVCSSALRISSDDGSEALAAFDVQGSSAGLARSLSQEDVNKLKAILKDALLEDPATKAKDKASATSWYKCSYDWEQQQKQTHTYDTTWSMFFNSLFDDIESVREKHGIKVKESITHEDVMTGSMEMLASAQKVLDELGVNWYISYGSVIGQLRSQGFIPWDDDVDILVKKTDQPKVVKWVSGGNSSGATKTDRRGGTASFRLVPHCDNRFIALSYVDAADVIQKVLWVNLETKLAIDFCLDCEGKKGFKPDTNAEVKTSKVPFGSLETKMDVEPFTAGNVLEESGVHGSTKEIDMPLAKENNSWTCELYECSEEPENEFPKAKDLGGLYKMDRKQMKGPFFFKVIDDPQDKKSLPPHGIASSLLGLDRQDWFDRPRSAVELLQRSGSHSSPDADRDNELVEALLEQLSHDPRALAQLEQHFVSLKKKKEDKTVVVGHGICAMPREMKSCKLKKKEEKKEGEQRVLQMLPCGWPNS